MFTIKKDMVFEDLTNLSATHSPTTQGTLGAQSSTVKTSLIDIIAKTPEDKQHPNATPNSNFKLNGTEFIVELIGNLYIDIEKLNTSITAAESNPVLNNRAEAKSQLAVTLKKIAILKKITDSISNDISNFSIEKPNM